MKRFIKKDLKGMVWQMVSSVLLLVITGGIGVFAAYAQTEGSSLTYAKEYFKSFMIHNWSQMYQSTDLEDTTFINSESFGEMMGNIVPTRGSDDYRFVDRGADGKYHIIDVVYKETGGKIEHTMTLRMRKKEEKNLLILNQWEVSLQDEVIEKCRISVPTDMQATLDGVSLENLEYKQNKAKTKKVYTIDKTLPGTHTLELTAVGGETVTETFFWDESRSLYRAKAESIPLNIATENACKDKAIDVIVSMYTGVLTGSGVKDVLAYFDTDKEKERVKNVYKELKKAVNREDGSMLVTMSFDDYRTKVYKYTYATKFSVRFNFTTTFKAKTGRTEVSGVREEYEGTTQGTAIVNFRCRDGQWIPTSVDMECFDYSEQEETEE